MPTLKISSNRSSLFAEGITPAQIGEEIGALVGEEYATAHKSLSVAIKLWALVEGKLKERGAEPRFEVNATDRRKFRDNPNSREQKVTACINTENHRFDLQAFVEPGTTMHIPLAMAAVCLLELRSLSDK